MIGPLMQTTLSLPRPLIAWPLLIAAGAGLAVTLQAPLMTTVVGLIALGVLHNLFELRYVASRYVIGLLSTRAVWLITAPLLVVIALRAGSHHLLPATAARQGEVVLVYGSLGIAAAIAPISKALRATLIGASAVGGAFALRWLGAHFLILTHLHNLMPIAFLLLHDRRNRWAIAAACLLWGGVVPALLLSGLLDGGLQFGAALAAGPVDALTAASLRSGWAPVWSTPVQTTRIAACFAFLQWMHYFVWIVYLPRFGGLLRPASSRGPITHSRSTECGWAGGVLLSRWGLAGALVLTAALVPLYLQDYIGGLSAYGTLAAFHALVEFPVLLLFLLSTKRSPRLATG